MPESEPKPRPLETVPAGSAQGWKAVLRNGRPVVVHEIPVAPAAAAAALPRIQRLSEHPHPSLSPILAWGSDANGVWVAVEPNEGTPLSTVLARGRLTPHAAAALGTSVLSGVAALHEAGVAMGGFDATAVRITANGEVRLAGHPVAAVRGAPSQGDLRADVRSCGMAICSAFGVDPAGAPAPPELPPGLVVTMRSMASGAMGPAVDRALGALREMSGPLMAPDRQTAAQSELAMRAGGRDVPAAAEPMREETPAPRPASYEPPPRSVDTYASIPKPRESFTPPPSYQSSPPTPAPPVAATPPPTPAAPPEPPPVPPPPAPEPAPVMFEAPAPAAPAPPVPDFAPEHPQEPEPEPIPIQEPAAAGSMWNPVASTPPTPEPAAPAVEPAAAPESDWPAPGSPVTNPATASTPPTPSTPAAPREQSGAPSWTPVQTGSWTPGKGHVSSSDWTGEQTPIPGPVPDELKEAISRPSYVAPAASAPSAPSEPAAPSFTEPSYSQPATYMPPAAPVTTPPIPRAPAPKPAERKPSDRTKPPGGGGFAFERPRWLVPAAIVVVVLLILGGGGAFALSKLGGASSSHVANNSPSANPSHKASPTPTNALREPQPVAPLAAAPLASTQFCQTSDPCRGGITQLFNCQLPGPCKLDIGIYLSGNAAQVTYQVQFFDKCTGDTKTLLGPKTDNVNNQRIWLPAPSNGWAVTLPDAKAAAVYVLVSVTGTATSIQSDFYSLPGSATSC